MNNDYYSRSVSLLTLVLSLGMVLLFSGCALFGLGAAAGAVVGGCSVLDANEDDQVTTEELSQGLYASWDTNDDTALSETEFDRGVERRDIYSDWSGNFDDWDTDDNDTLSQAEFDSGIAQGDTSEWLDSQCDDLGL
jgi:hypothetical protein